MKMDSQYALDRIRLANRYPWARNYGGSFRLGEFMRSFHVHVLLDFVEELADLSSWSANDPSWKEDALNDEDKTSAIDSLQGIEQICSDFGFNALKRQVGRDLYIVKEGTCTYAELARIAANLRQRIRDEYEEVVLLWIEDDEFFLKDDLFGEQVGQRFKEASFDIREAGTCFSLRRYTACVYHLMRVAEAGLVAIAKRVGHPDQRPMWEPVLTFIDAELKRNRAEMSDRFKGDLEFISGISSQMHALNLACRRRVAHVERKYSLEEAKRILDTTRGLMQHIATKLSEVEDE